MNLQKHRMEYIKVKVLEAPGVSVIQLNRPEALNALNLGLMTELVEALTSLDNDPDTKAIIIHGNDKAFAAGADIKQMAEKSAIEMLEADMLQIWGRIKRVKKPLIAAISGFTLGGGCELAMACDMIVASETALLGQPEIKIGIMPGCGGTQRLTRAIGKARAMEMVLAGKMIKAHEALDFGLINQVVPVEMYLQEAFGLAKKVASMAPVAAQLAKDSVNKAFETHLDEGLQYERKNYYLTYATQDQKEGMKAFIEKRKPNYTGK